MTRLDMFTLKALGGFGNWDSVYFLHISEFGYDYEQMMAFFPVFPIAVSCVASAISTFSFNAFGRLASLYLASTFMNCLAFVLAAFFLHKLTLCVTKSTKFADVTTVLFCLNPANVFTMAAYTESMYLCFQFSAMFALESGVDYSKYLTAGILFALGAGTRSNGLLSAGFMVCAALREVLQSCVIVKHEENSWKKRQNVEVTKLINIILAVIIGLFTSTLPFVIFQFHGHSTYCSDITRTAQFANHWCNGTVPLSYNYIQRFYWNVGPFRYYEMKQIPNFILALPTIVMSFGAVSSFFSPKRWLDALLEYLNVTEQQNGRLSPMRAVGTCQNAKFFPYVCHLFFLLMFGVINIHIQVLTRLLFSSSPVLYWYAASTFSSADKEQCHLLSKSGMLLMFFVFYTLVGLLMHCNFYPWT